MSASLQTTHRVLIGKTPTAIGLTWTALLNGEAQKPKAEASELLRSQNLRYGALFESEVARAKPMLGMVGRDAPKGIVGSVPAATWLAEVVKHPTIYIENVPGKVGSYWLLAAWPGRIHPKTDLTVGTDATREMEGILGDFADDNQDVEIVIGGDGSCPSSNVIERARRRSASLAELLSTPPSRELPRVRQYTGMTPGVLVALLATITLGGLAAGSYVAWDKYQARKAAEAMLAAQMTAQGPSADLQALSDARVREAVEKALAEDTRTAPPEDVIASCMAAVAKMPRLMGGWGLSRLNCTPGAVMATYDMSLGAVKGASAERFVNDARGHGFDPRLDFGTVSATVQVPIEGIALRPGLTLETLPRYSEAAVQFPSRLQMLNGIAKHVSGRFDAPLVRDVQFEDPVQTAAQQGQSVMMPVPAASTYKRGTFVLQGDALLGLFQLQWNEPYFTVLSIDVMPQQQGGFGFSLNGQYVVSTSG